MIFFLHREERRNPLWIQLYGSNVCSHLPILLLCSTTTTSTTSSTDPPHHPHPPPPCPPHGSSGPSHACSTSASSSSCHCSKPTARVGIPATTTTMPLPNACSSSNSCSCSSMSTTMPTTMLCPCSSLPTGLSPYVLQEAIRIKSQRCTYEDNNCGSQMLLYLGLFHGVSLWRRRWTLLCLGNDRREEPLRWSNNNIYVRTFCRIFYVLVTNLCTSFMNFMFLSEFVYLNKVLLMRNIFVSGVLNLSTLWFTANCPVTMEDP